MRRYIYLHGTGDDQPWALRARTAACACATTTSSSCSSSLPAGTVVEIVE